MSLTYDVTHPGETVEVVMSGRIDRDASEVMEQAYRQAGGQGPLVLAFEDVDYINSTGIALIVGLLGKARADGRQVLARGLSDHYEHIFEITRLSDFITIVEPLGTGETHE